MQGLEALRGVEAFLFDVFGTVVDWQGSVAREVQEKHYDGILEREWLLGWREFLKMENTADSLLVLLVDWIEFAKEWRKGYIENTCVLGVTLIVVLSNPLTRVMVGE